MTVFTKLKCWGSGEISKSWNSWMESAEIVCVRGKLGDLLTCGKNFCVNKRQLLTISRFSAKLQYILPLRSYNMRLQLQGDVSHWNFDVSFWGSEGLPNPQSEKGGVKGVEGTFTMFLWFFFKHFWTKTAALHWLPIFAHIYRLHMVMLWKRSAD